MHTVRSADGTALRVDRFGSGPALVLVEGALNDLKTTMPVGALLADRFTVSAYDRRGRGGSGDTAPYAVQGEIEDLAAVVADAGGSAAVFANCSGGALALAAAAAGVPVTAMVLYEPPYLTGGLHEVPPGYTDQLDALLVAGRRGDAVELFMRRLVLLPDEHVTMVQGSPMWPTLEALAPTLAYDNAVMGDYALPLDRLAGVRVPTLVVDGDQSADWARHSVKHLVEALPRGSGHTLLGHSHLLVPHAVAPVIAGFCA